MDFLTFKQKALEVQNLYNKLNKSKGEKKWQSGEYMAGLVGDIGDLSKLVMSKNGYRGFSDLENNLKHEIVDILWAVFIIANELDIDVNHETDEWFNSINDRIKKEIEKHEKR